MSVFRPIRHEDRLSALDHLDELRTRLMLSVAALLLVFCICYAENGRLISVLNRALPAAAKTGLGSQQSTNADLGKLFGNFSTGLNELSSGLAQSKSVSPQAAAAAAKLAAESAQISKILPKEADAQAKPLTIGVAESFTTTLVVCAYFALLISLPFLLYQLYAYVIPALSHSERRVAVPALLAAPFLFAMGVVFTYFWILPPAIHFLLGYNSKHFQILVQANSYYKFEIILMLAIGLAFQVPLLLLGLQQMGVITARTLTKHWRYALVLIAVIAAALPGVDPVTMFFETLPLVFIYGLSIVLLRFADRRSRNRAVDSGPSSGEGDPDN